MDKLNTLYDSFTKKYGLINSRANTSAFSDDSSYALLSALEVINEDGELERKADMFFKRTIKPHKPVTEVDTADEALAVSMGEKAAIDMEYMMELSGKSEEELFADLKGVIFLNPLYEYGNSYEPKYLMADEYLSGNVREKLATAKRSAALYPEDYTVNVQALEKVQPKDLTASEISVRLGATWIPPEIFQQFMFEFLDTPRYAQWNIKVHYSQFTGEWNIEGKSYDRSNVKAYSTYGTSRINAYKIIEETLNLKDVRIFDYIEDEEGRKKAVLNKKETAIAQAKQELIKQGFQDWIWADPARREKLTKMYNEKFNSIRPREYDGSHIVFNGMNPEIELREHQKNAVAHILYGGNTLLAHAVGAGKTFVNMFNDRVEQFNLREENERLAELFSDEKLQEEAQWQAYSVKEISRLFSISEEEALKLMNCGLFKTYRVGNEYRASKKSVEENKKIVKAVLTYQDKKTMSVPDVMRILGLGKTATYRLINQCRFKTYLVLGKMRVDVDMVADVYSHIIDEDRRYNAQKFEEQFYNAKGLKNAEEGKTAPMPKFETSVELLDPMAEVQKESEVEKEKPAENSTDENAALLTKLLSNPETAALLKALAKTI